MFLRAGDFCILLIANCIQSIFRWNIDRFQGPIIIKWTLKREKTWIYKVFMAWILNPGNVGKNNFRLFFLLLRAVFNRMYSDLDHIIWDAARVFFHPQLILLLSIFMWNAVRILKFMRYLSVFSNYFFKYVLRFCFKALSIIRNEWFKTNRWRILLGVVYQMFILLLPFGMVWKSQNFGIFFFENRKLFKIIPTSST